MNERSALIPYALHTFIGGQSDYESMGIKAVAPSADLEAALGETHNEGEDDNSMMD